MSAVSDAASGVQLLPLPAVLGMARLQTITGEMVIMEGYFALHFTSDGQAYIAETGGSSSEDEQASPQWAQNLLKEFYVYVNNGKLYVQNSDSGEVQWHCKMLCAASMCTLAIQRSTADVSCCICRFACHRDGGRIFLDIA